MAPRWTCHLRLVGSLQHHHCGVRRWGAQETVDAEAVKGVFPYGSVFLQVVDGGLRASSGVAIPALGAPPPPPPTPHTHARGARRHIYQRAELFSGGSQSSNFDHDQLLEESELGGHLCKASATCATISASGPSFQSNFSGP